jgi:ATP-dependent DNA helicase RecQ
MPAFMVFPDKTLRALVHLRPTTREALRAVHGIGDRKLEAFGGALLKALAEER